MTTIKRPMASQDIGHPRPKPLATDYGVTVGGLIRRELSAHNLSQAQLATRTGLSTKHINQVIQGVVPLSTDTALILERTLGISADLLTAVEAGHQAREGRKAAQEGLAVFRTWFRGFPLRELTKRDIISAKATPEEQIGELLAFFGVADHTAFNRLYAEEAVSFKRSQHLDVDTQATAVWLRLAERQADALDCAPYDRKAFVNIVKSLRSLTCQPIREAFPRLQDRCAEVGVAVVLTPDVSGARAYSAIRWLGPNRPLVALSGRGQFEDGLWFAFFHEAGHILLHPKRRSLIHLDDLGDDSDGAESEANDFARRTLLGPIQTEVLKSVGSLQEAESFAAIAGVDPGIIAGQVAYAQGGRAWAKYRSLRRKSAFDLQTGV